VIAVLAAPLLAGVLEVVLADCAAYRASDFFTFAPAHFPEQGKRLIVGQFHDFAHGEGAGFGGEEEVLRHDYHRLRYVLISNDISCSLFVKIIISCMMMSILFIWGDWAVASGRFNVNQYDAQIGSWHEPVVVDACKKLSAETIHETGLGRQGKRLAQGGIEAP